MELLRLAVVFAQSGFAFYLSVWVGFDLARMIDETVATWR